MCMCGVAEMVRGESHWGGGGPPIFCRMGSLLPNDFSLIKLPSSLCLSTLSGGEGGLGRYVS